MQVSEITFEASGNSAAVLEANKDLLSIKNPTLTGGIFSGTVRFISGVDTRIPVGMWNYYPAAGLFSPSNPGEDFQHYAFISTGRWDFDAAQNDQLAEALTMVLQNESKEVVLSAIEDIFGGPSYDLKVHPLVIWLEAHRSLDAGEDQPGFDEDFWETLLYSPKSIFVAPLVFSPIEFDTKDLPELEGLRVPHLAIPRGAYEQSYKDIVELMVGRVDPDSLAVSPDPTKPFSLSSFTAHYRSGATAQKPLTPQEVAQVNVIEMIKGDPEGVAFYDHISELYPELEGEAALDEIRDQIVKTGSFSSRFAKTFYDKASREGDFRNRRYTVMMCQTMNTEKAPWDYEQQVFQATKALNKTMGQLLAVLK